MRKLAIMAWLLLSLASHLSAQSENSTVGTGNIDTDIGPRSSGSRPVTALISLSMASRTASTEIACVAAAMIVVHAATTAATKMAIRFTPIAVF